MSFHIKINVKVIGALHCLCVTEMYIFDAISWLRTYGLFAFTEFHGWCPLKSVSLLSHVEVYQASNGISPYDIHFFEIESTVPTSKSALDNPQSHCVYRLCMFPSI